MTEKEIAKETLKHLVDRFENQIETYKQSNYNETQTRIDFIDPFFSALGWDVSNKQGNAEAYREVIHEDRIKIGGATKAPDYSFKLPGGKRLFFVEAKKPSVAVKDDIIPAYQIRRYGWSAKLPISIITDFEEFAVYDCSIKPNQTDKASVARIKYLNFKDYIQEFDFLWDTFSKEQVLKGSFDKYIKSDSNKKGTTTVDKEFLISLDNWRTLFAENLVKNNKTLDEDEINFVVQQTIDRIVFLRIAEDRSIETYGNLKNALNKGVYFENLYNIFKEADQKYNSGLFDLNKDKFSSNIKIDNTVIKTIINQMYFPESPYEFSVLSVEILGSAYEQFLGKTITITDKHKIVIEQKPEVRKAGGVYYTPQYIVEYIVNNTVGKLIENKTPYEVSSITICDPACGSGSFLLGAYQFLLDWHKNYYNSNPSTSTKIKDKLLTPDGNLTTTEKRRILVNNIYGVDIDANAVEVTKLSLLLKCLEGETEASISQQMKLFSGERLLPTLENNILSGNSLIDYDFYENNIDFGEEKKIKPFSWKKSFPKVFAKGGFDAVIGNPPYIKLQTMSEFLPNSVINHYKNKYYCGSNGNFDIYVLFIEKGYKLINDDGLLGYILPHKFFTADFGELTRNFIIENKSLEKVIYFGANQIFENATTYTCLLFLNKVSKNKFLFQNVKDPLTWRTNDFQSGLFEINLPEKTKKWNFTDNNKQELIDKLNSINLKLKDITRKIYVGLQTSADKIYVLSLLKENDLTYSCISKSLNKEIEIEKGLVKLFLMGKDVKRYSPIIPKSVVIFPYNFINNKAILMETDFIKNNFPFGWAYLMENKSELENREKGKMKKIGFYAYIYPKNLLEFESTKIILPDITNKPEFTYDLNQNLYHTTTVYGIKFNTEFAGEDLFYLGLLNSKLNWYFVSSTGTILRGGYTRFHKQYVENFPIPSEIKLEDKLKIVELVDTLLQLNKEIYDASLESKKTFIKNKIEYCEDKINQIVYELYELTPEEIKIIEGE